MRILTLKLVTRGEQSPQMAGEVLADNNEAIRELLAIFYFTARICRIKGLENFFLKTAQKLLNQITALTGLITIEYLLILSQT